MPYTKQDCQELRRDPIDMLLVGNLKLKTKKLEDWSKERERERRSILLEQVKQEKTHGKSRRGKEKVLMVSKIRTKDMKR